MGGFDVEPWITRIGFYPPKQKQGGDLIENNKVSTFENGGGGKVCPTDLIQIVSRFPHFVRLYYSSSWEILDKAFHIHQP